MSDGDAIDEDEDDFFGNPLKHLRPKMIDPKVNGHQTSNCRKKVSLGNDDDDDDSVLLMENEKHRNGGDRALSKVEQEIEELEMFSKTSFPLQDVEEKKPAMSRTTGKSAKKRKVTDDESPKSDDRPSVNADTEMDDNSVIIDDEPFVMEPHCSIEICDLENYNTQIIRWKMGETFDGIAEKYASEWSCSPDNISLSLKCGKKASLKDTPLTLSFSKNDINYLSVHKSTQCIDVHAAKLSIKWLIQDRYRPIIYAIHKNVPFRILKRDFAVDNGLDVEKLKLVFDGECIGPEDTAEKLGIEGDDCIDVYITD